MIVALASITLHEDFASLCFDENAEIVDVFKVFNNIFESRGIFDRYHINWEGFPFLG